jgi:hypothetical protein
MNWSIWQSIGRARDHPFAVRMLQRPSLGIRSRVGERNLRLIGSQELGWTSHQAESPAPSASPNPTEGLTLKAAAVR